MGSLPPLHLLRLCAPVAANEKRDRGADDAEETPPAKRQITKERLRFGIYVAWKGEIPQEAVDNDVLYEIDTAVDLPTKSRIIRTLEGVDSEEDQLFCQFTDYMLDGIRQDEEEGEETTADHFVCAFDTEDYVTLPAGKRSTVPSAPAPKLVGLITVSARMSPQEWSNAALSLLDDPNSVAFLSPKAQRKWQTRFGKCVANQKKNAPDGKLEDDQKFHCRQMWNRMSFELKFVCTNNGQGYKRDDPEYIPGILRGMVRAVEQMVVEYWVKKAWDDYLKKMEELDPDYVDANTLDRLLHFTVLNLETVSEAVKSYEAVGFKATNDFSETDRMFKFGYDFHDFSY